MHFVTFSCYRREPLLQTARAREIFETELERVRRWYGVAIAAYVVMPEHVHLLMGEPERGELSLALQMLKQIVSRKVRPAGLRRFWQSRYYDFCVWSEEKFRQKIDYIHLNPVRRGLVERAEDWRWSSYRHYARGVDGVVEIESELTANRRERLGGRPRLKVLPPYSAARNKGGAASV